MTLMFTVHGVAQPKDNLRPLLVRSKTTGLRVPVVTESNRSVRAWSQLVARGAIEALQRRPDAELLGAGVRLTIRFYLPRPQSLPRRPTAHTKRPDLDKLVRGIMDALTAVVWQDDSQVCELVATKHYVEADDRARVEIRVEPTAGEEALAVPPAPLPLLESLR